MAVRAARREWEAEFVSEYTLRTYPGAPVRYHIRLGTWPTPLSSPDLTEPELAMLTVRRRWADALVILPGKLVVIEGKLRPSEYLKGLGELQLYVHLVPHTPELEAFKGAQVRGRLVCSLEDPTVRMLANRAELEFDVYQPKFWQQYLTALSGREKRPIRPEESQLLKLGKKA